MIEAILKFFWIGAFAFVWPLSAAEIKVSDGNPGQPGSPLNERKYLEDAFRDAQIYFPGVIDKPIDQCHFSTDRGFSADLMHNGQFEFIVAGNIDGQINYVLLYYSEEDQWRCEILNRCLGGSIFEVKVLDVDNDGALEVYSILKDVQLKKYCRISKLSGGESQKISVLFSLDTKGGLQSSYNISLMRSNDKESYKVRVDEMEYPTDEGGDVHQRTYFYALVQNMFVLEHSWSGKQ